MCDGVEWRKVLSELIKRSTSDLPADVERALRAALAMERECSRAAILLRDIIDNTLLARARATPLCQDTGTLNFYWSVPRGSDVLPLEAATRAAVAYATTQGWLRQNTIETLSGASLTDNLAVGVPLCHFEFHEAAESEVWLLQKGGGCENVSAQYALPDSTLQAGRDIAGVRKCVLDAVWRSQGYGCAPGILGVCIGADRAQGFAVAKRQLLRPLHDHAQEPELAALEEQLLAEANTLGIGPMGMGGNTTLLGVKMAARARLPASFFVTVAYMCWASRRCGVRVKAEGALEWLAIQ